MTNYVCGYRVLDKDLIRKAWNNRYEGEEISVFILPVTTHDMYEELQKFLFTLHGCTGWPAGKYNIHSIRTNGGLSNFRNRRNRDKIYITLWLDGRMTRTFEVNAYEENEGKSLSDYVVYLRTIWKRRRND